MAARTGAGSDAMLKGLGKLTHRRARWRSVFDLVKDRPGTDSGVGAEHPGREGDEAIPRMVGGDEGIAQPLRDVGRLDVRDPEPNHLWLPDESAIHQLEHPRHA